MNACASRELPLIGAVRICETDGFITAISFTDSVENTPSTELINRTFCQLQEYLSNKRKIFDIPIKPCGTKFQMLIWDKLLNIPYGKTLSYAELAGDRRYARAAGQACNRNPIGIIIPCHRVVGCKGGLTGYAGGISVKKNLLMLEQAIFTPNNIH